MAYEVVTKAPQESETGSHSLNIMGYFHAIRRRKSLMCLGVVVGLTLGVLYYMRVPPVYESYAKVLITNKNADVLQSREHSGYGQDLVANQISMIRSPLIARQAAVIMLEKEIPGFQDPDESVSQKLLHAAKNAQDATGKSDKQAANPEGDVAKLESQSPKQEEAGKEEKTAARNLIDSRAGMILGGLNATRGDVRSGESTSVVMLSARTGSAGDSNRILNAVIEAHKHVMAASYHDLGEETVELISRMKDDLGRQLEEKEKKYNDNKLQALNSSYSKDHLLGAESDKASLAERASFQARMEALVMRDAEIRAHLDAMRKAMDARRRPEALLAMAERFTGASAQANANLYSDKLIDLIIKERELSSTYGNEYLPLQRIRNQISFLKGILPANRQPPDPEDKEDPIERHIRQLEEERECNATLSEAYGKLIQDRNGRMREVLTNELETEKLNRDYLRTKELWEASSKRLQEINLVKNMVGVSAMVLAQPSDGHKVAPILSSSLSLSMFLGFLIGLMLVYLAEMTDRSFKGPDDVVSRLGAPVIAHMPAIDYKKLVSGTDLEPGATLSPVLCVHYRPKSRDAEAIRGIRTAIFFGNQANTTRLIQFTSAQAGDGKSTLACNVAISIAQSGKRVILVEADLRRPSFASIFGKTPDVGFAQVLEGTESWQENLMTFPEIPNLAVLPCGKRPQHPAELLTGPLLAETLDQMKAAYDYVIIDTPPLLPVTDPCSVAARADGVILVVQMGRNTRPNAERACSLLETLGVRLLGIVMNRMTKDGGYGYGYGYGGYGYNYGGGYKYGGYAYRSTGYYARSDAYYEEDHRNGVEDKTPAQ